MDSEVKVAGTVVGGLLICIFGIIVILVVSHAIANDSKLECIEKVKDKTAAEIKVVCG